MPGIATGQRSKPLRIPAPIAGLNGREGLADMGPKFAYVLDNLDPGTTSVDARGGHTNFATGLGGAVETLVPHVGGATQKLLGFANGSIFDCTLGGAVGGALQSGRVSNQIIHAPFSNAGNQFTIGVSGLDVPFSYNGAAIANLVMTGMTGSAANLSYVFGFKGRLYFAQKDQLGFYYLAVGAIQGALSYFDLSQVASKGGWLMAMYSFSQDSGTGLADYFVALTSEGEHIVYRGTDPSNVATWEIVSRYYSAPPIGRKCVVKYGTDPLIITTEGVLPLSKIAQEGGAIAAEDALSANLGKLLSDLNIYRDSYGWQGCAYPLGNKLIINVPASSAINGTFYQYVMNSKTNAWTRYTRLNGICWTTHKQRLYFGTYDGRVCLADEGRLDNGAQIQFDSRQAYNDFDDGYGGGMANKLWHFAEVLCASDGEPPLSAQFNVDYKDEQPVLVPGLPAGSEGVWDIATWDVDGWGAAEVTQKFMAAIGQYGQVGSLWLRGSLNGTTFKWYATRYIYERAKGLF